jgi:hypothetical protein
MRNEEEIANVVLMGLTFIGILFAASILGLTLSIIKGILLAFGIESTL